MQAKEVRGHTLELCSQCMGVLVSMASGQALGVDFATLLTLEATPVGPGARQCGAHARAMNVYRISTAAGAIEVDHSPCCQMVFLDAGEAASLGKSMASPAVSTPACPSCRGATQLRELDHVEVPACERCNVMIVSDAQSLALGIDIELVFAEDAWGATYAGETTWPCSVCGAGNVTHFRPGISGDEYSTCHHRACGTSMFPLHKTERLRAFTRKASFERADADYAAGRTVRKNRADDAEIVRRAREAAGARGERERRAHQSAAVNALQSMVESMRYDRDYW